jgi:hypothetical protein
VENQRFDRLTKFVAHAASRRAVLRALGIVGPGILGATVGLDHGQTAIAKKKNQGKRTMCHCGSADPQSCKTVTIGKQAAKKHLERHCDYGGACRDNVVNPCDPGSQCLPLVRTNGRAELTGTGVVTLTTEANPPFGSARFGFPSGTLFGEIASVSSSFDFTTGSCGAGTPRFCFTFEGRDDCACAQFPTELCNDPGEEQGDTGDLIGNNTPGLWFRLCADGPNINTYNDALAQYAGEVLDTVFIVADESNGEQTVTLEPCITLV